MLTEKCIFNLSLYAYSGMLLWSIFSSIFMDKVSETRRQLQQQQKIPVEETWGKRLHSHIYLFHDHNTENISLFNNDNVIM